MTTAMGHRPRRRRHHLPGAGAALRACVRSGRGDGFLERSADQHPKMKETTMSATRSVRRSDNTTVSSPQRGATVLRRSARAMTRGKGLAFS